MLIIPAIDLRSGRVVRLTQGDYAKETFYSGNPAEVAKEWAAQGAKLIHVVDLDGALEGEPRNLAAVDDICQAIKVPVQLGGGLRTYEAIERALSKGASRVVIGTKACTDDQFTKKLIADFKDKIAVSIDACGENVATAGWTSTTAMKAENLAKKMESFGVKTIIYTNILKDGTLEGLDLDQVRTILDTVDIEVIIAGGVSSLKDIEDLKSLNSPNLAGVITGKALYEGNLNLKEAIKVAEGE